MGDNDTIDTSVKNNEISKAPVAGFNVHPENINRNGRPPKGHSITETIRAMMDERPEIKKALAAKVLQMASEGDITAMKTIWNYLDGMPTQKQEITADIFNVTRGLNDTSQHVRSDEPTPETETNS